MDREQALKMQKRRDLYRQRPDLFCEDVLGITPYDKQIEIMDSVRDNRITSAASCNSAGKTGISGCVVPWFLLTHHESIVVTTAPKWQQVKDLLWREINTRWEKAGQRIGMPLSDEKPTVTSWELKSNWFAVGVASKDPNKIQGYHPDSGDILVVIDEAAAIAELMYEGVWALMTGAGARLLELGNPTSQSGTFRDHHKPGSLANRIRIDMFDTPNFVANNIRNEEDLLAWQKRDPKFETVKMPYKSLVSPQWGYESLKRWGVNSPMYQSRVRARFPEVGENNLIPLNWIEQACSNERLDSILGLDLTYGDDTQEMKNQILRQTALAEYVAAQNTSRGVDLARFGSDSTVVTPRWNKVVGRQTVWHKLDTMQSAGRIWPLIENKPTDFTGLDVIGVGAGVVDRLHELQQEQRARGFEQWATVTGVNVADAPTEKPEYMATMEFANKRAELYWKLRGMFESGDIYLIPDEDGRPPEDLMYELSAIQYDFRGSKIFIEEKKEMKKRLQKSPDRADSLVLSLGLDSGGHWIPESDKPLEEEDEDWEPPTRTELEEQSADNWANQVY